MKVVSDELHFLTGAQQRAASAYHRQSNGLVKRQNRQNSPLHGITMAYYIYHGLLYVNVVSHAITLSSYHTIENQYYH